MTRSPDLCGRYADLPQLDDAWARLARTYGGREITIGTSANGRPLRRYDFGNPLGPTFLLTSLMHGVEVIGGLALLDAVRSILASGRAGVAARARLVVVPVVNPDAFADNLERLRGERRASQRCNARGVDLNRNFAPLSSSRPLHPFAGSRFRWSPHYTGPHAFSEPESRALRDVALETRPALAIGFHSCGNFLLYPWAHTDVPNPREPLYRALGDAFCQALPRERYEVRQAAHWYPTVGDMDDWLDANLGTLAFTVEVSRPARSFRDIRRLLNPFWWLNPREADEAIGNVVPGVGALLCDALDRGVGGAPSRAAPPIDASPVELFADAAE
ncbi:M14 family metallopeptidase [Sorangium sp. So ce693]|uniref:M14 family metallopeptidase n=1 Tax=Sorangium sp. So ce693 TaxID=3133318 RepID=UPI003F61D13B